jgi:DHA2 family multidrug resistance protein
VFGLSMLALSLFHMAHFNLEVDFRTAMMARVYQSSGMAFLFVPINVMAFYFVPKEKINNATGIINLARNVGGSVGIAGVVTMLARRAQFHQAVLVSHMTPLDSAYQAMLNGAKQILIAQGSNPVQAATQAQGLAYGLLMRHASMLAFLDDFWLMAVFIIAIIPFMFLMKKARPHKGAAEAF